MTLDAHFTARRSDTFEVSVKLSVADGSTTALLGPNGAGKSTIVSALSGLLPISDGKIVIADRVVDDPAHDVFVPPESRGIGVVFQGLQLFEHLSVRQNVEFGPRAQGRSSRESAPNVDALLELFELFELADRGARDLSGGQAQRVAVARALAISPTLLLLDEPLSSLDVSTRSRVRKALSQQLETFSGPRVLITHDPTDAFLLADEIVVLENGRVTQAGTPDSIRRHPATPYVAALSGRNLLDAHSDAGFLTVRGSEQPLQTSDTSVRGPVMVSIAPSAIALHPEQPHGSPRNSWKSVVTAIEPLGDTSRVYLGQPLPLTADLTPGAVRSLGLEAGTPIWVSIKATEIDVAEV